MNSINATVDTNLVIDFNTLPAQARIIDTRETTPESERSQILPRYKIIALVNETGLDLLCVKSDAPDKVYRLLDYSKFRFDQQKRQKEAERKQRENARSLKECFFSPGITDHDYVVKLKQIRGWLKDHDVKIAMKLNFQARSQLGRSANLHQVARDPNFVLNRVITELGDTIIPTRLVVNDKTILTTLRTS